MGMRIEHTDVWGDEKDILKLCDQIFRAPSFIKTLEEHQIELIENYLLSRHGIDVWDPEGYMEAQYETIRYWDEETGKTVTDKIEIRPKKDSISALESKLLNVATYTLLEKQRRKNESHKEHNPEITASKESQFNLQWEGKKYELCEIIQALQLSGMIHENGKPLTQKRILEVFSSFFPDEKLDPKDFNTKLQSGYKVQKRNRDNRFAISDLKPKFLEFLEKLIIEDKNDKNP